MGAPSQAEPDDLAAIEGFLRGDDRATVDLLLALRPCLRSEIGRRWPSMRSMMDDLEAESTVTLLDWRARKLVRVGESIQDLAARLVHQSALAEKRHRARTKRTAEVLAHEPRAPAASAEELVLDDDLRQRLWALTSKLPARYQRALAAHANQPPPLTEVFGIDPAAAKKLFQRARAALAREAKAVRLELGEEPLATGAPHG